MSVLSTTNTRDCYETLNRKKRDSSFFFRVQSLKTLRDKILFFYMAYMSYSPSVENFSLPALYPPHYKWFSSLPYSPLCRKVFAIYISIKLTLYTDSPDPTHYPHLKFIHGSLIISPTIIIDIPSSVFPPSEKFAIIPVLKVFIDTLSKSPIWKFIFNPCPYPTPYNLNL